MKSRNSVTIIRYSMRSQYYPEVFFFEQSSQIAMIEFIQRSKNSVIFRIIWKNKKYLNWDERF